MARPRNAAGNQGEDQGENPPPPPLPTMEQVMMMQAQMLQAMQQTLANMHANQNRPPPQRDKLGAFQRTKPPTFSHSVEPIDVDDWLKSMEKKLQVVQCVDREKVLLASHQLEGPASNWWDAYMEAHDDATSINWLEFKTTFRAHFVPQGVIKLRKKEF
jgi:hypothetical protein